MSVDTDIEIEVIDQTGHCDVGHKVGDTFLITNYKTPAGICLSAFHVIWASARTLIFNGKHPWEDNEGETTVACPDPNNPVVFRIKRKGNREK